MWEAIPLQPCRKSLCQVAMACSPKFAVAQDSRRCLTKRNVTAVRQLCQVVSLPLLRLVLVALLLVEAMLKVVLLARWLVLWQLGRVRCRILVSSTLLWFWCYEYETDFFHR